MKDLGTTARMVDGAMSFGRSLWSVASERAQRRGDAVALSAGAYAAWLKDWRSSDATASSEQAERLLASLEQRGWMMTSKTDVVFDGRVFTPSRLLPLVLDGRLDSDVRYLMRRNTRRAFCVQESPEVAHIFYLLAKTVAEIVRQGSLPADELALGGLSKELRRRLEGALERDEIGNRDQRRFCDLYLEVCRSLNEPTTSADALLIGGEWREAPRLLAYLWGLPSDIPGFDNLFSGSGLNLREKLSPDAPSPPRGRLCLIRGKFGSGKTSLALMLAAEVASKGGFVVLVAFEYTVDECLLLLESFGYAPGTRPFAVMNEKGVTLRRGVAFGDAAAADDEQGILTIIASRPAEVTELLDEVSKVSQRTKGQPLRLLIIDPVNSLQGLRPQDREELRAEVLKRITETTRDAANLLFVCEDDETDPSPVAFLSNLADTVIELQQTTIAPDRRGALPGYSQRYIEVLKSRLQVERAGRHPVNIEPNAGITVTPSTAAFQYPDPHRAERTVRPVRFGWPELDHLLGDDALYAGDSLILRGREGVYKSPISFFFARGSDTDSDDPAAPRHTSLIVPIRERTGIHAIERALGRMAEHRPNNRMFEILELPSGFVYPGRILQKVHEQLQRALDAGRPVDRALIANVARWETGAPFVREDVLFPGALADLLQKFGVTTLFVCGPDDPGAAAEGRSEYSLQRTLVDDAHVVLEAERVDFFGTQRVILRIVRTRSMRHAPEWHDVTSSGGKLHLDLSLLRVDKRGTVKTVVPQIFLHSDDESQDREAKGLQRRLRDTLSRETEVIAENRTTLFPPLEFGQFSSEFSLRIAQTDEFQLPMLYGSSSSSSRPTAQSFGTDGWEDLLGDLDDNLRSCVLKDGRLWAVPYMRNLALLTSTGDAGNSTESWQSIADLVASGKATFAYEQGTHQDINVLFLEIALWCLRDAGGPVGLPARVRDFSDWMRQAPIRRACQLFRSLCCGTRKSVTMGTPRNATFSRRWYPGIFRAFQNEGEADGVRVTALPGDIAVSGDWFLTVLLGPVGEIGMRIIRSMLEPHAELERARAGVGLPVRRSFYDSGFTMLPPETGFSGRAIQDLLERAHRRSHIDGYVQFSPILHEHLQRMISAGDGERLDDAALSRIIDNLDRNIKFLVPHPR